MLAPVIVVGFVRVPELLRATNRRFSTHLTDVGTTMQPQFPRHRELTGRASARPDLRSDPRRTKTSWIASSLALLRISSPLPSRA
jgi:hypothetical protein